jgi:phage/plasmid-associated DNA primase
VAYSEEGATGKSTFLLLLRSLPNEDAVASVPPGKFGDEKYAHRLIGRVLNAADELPDRALRSDVFKRMITGEPVPARDVYCSATDFAPVALHVFSTNVLPSFSGGVDGGTVRRLLPIEFTHVVPESERDPDLPEKILTEEANLFLHFAVEGACRLVRNRDFTVPASSCELLKRWVLSADPVRAWAAERLEVTVDENRVSVAALYADFHVWAERQGLKSEFLPNIISFGRRLRSAASGLEYLRSDGSACRNARIRAR